jgi:tetratricopeptide (TPR) repeat protein
VLRVAWKIVVGGLVLSMAVASSWSRPAYTEAENRILAEARRLREELRFPAAIEAFSQVIERHPQAWELRAELAQLLLSTRDLAGAELQLQQAILISRDEARLWSRLAQVYLLKEDLDHAEQSLIEARRLDPGDGGVRYNLALLYEKLERHEEAFEEYKAFLDIGGDEALVRLATHKVVQYLEYMGEPLQAIPYLRRVVDLAPDQIWPRQRLADILYRIAEYDEALEQYRRIIELAPDNASAHFNVGFILKLREDLEGAEREMSLALRLAPPTSKSLYNLGAVRFERGDFAGAAESFEKAIEMEPDHVQAHYHYARALMKLGRREDAMREMKLHEEVLRRRDEEQAARTMDRSGEDL